MTPHHNNVGDHAGEIGGVILSVITYLATNAFVHDELVLIFNTIITAVIGGTVGFFVQYFWKKIFKK